MQIASNTPKKARVRLLMAWCAITAGFGTMACGGQILHAEQRPPARALRGTNYFLSTTAGLDNMTGHLPFDNESGVRGAYSLLHTRQEIDKLAELGINNIRLFPSWLAYVADRDAYLRTLRELSEVCIANRISITYVVWNAIGAELPTALFDAVDPTRIVNHDFYIEVLNRSLRQHQRQSERLGGLPANEWQGTLWREPPFAFLEAGSASTWRNDVATLVAAYLNDVGDFFGADPIGKQAFFSYDLYNEVNPFDEVLTSAFQFMRYTHDRLESLHPSAHFTIGWAGDGTDIDTLNDRAIDDYAIGLTYQSFHTYKKSDIFAQTYSARAAYGAQHGFDSVVSEFWRNDLNPGTLGYNAAHLDAFEFGGQVWSVLENNARDLIYGQPHAVDGVVRSIFPGSFFDVEAYEQPLTFEEKNGTDRAHVEAWARGTLALPDFTEVRVQTIDGNDVANALRAGQGYRLHVVSPFPETEVWASIATVAGEGEASGVFACLEPLSCPFFPGFGFLLEGATPSLRHLGRTDSHGNLTADEDIAFESGTDVLVAVHVGELPIDNHVMIVGHTTTPKRFVVRE